MMLISFRTGRQVLARHLPCLVGVVREVMLGKKWGWDIKIQNIPLWSYPDAAAAGAAAATSAGASALCI